MEVGVKLFAEMLAPQDLVRQPVLAEEAGFDFLEMSDHFHPWFEQPNKSPHEGHSGFAWSTLGMIAAAGHGGSGDKIGEMPAAFADTEEIGLKAATASFRWAMFGMFTDSEIPRASDFAAASQFVRPSDLATIMAADPDPAKYLALAQEYADAGFTSLSLVSLGPDMEAFPVRRRSPDQADPAETGCH